MSYVQLIGIRFLILWPLQLHTGMEESCFCFCVYARYFKVSVCFCFTSDAPRYGMGSETPMHPSRTPLHSYMTPMRDYAGLFLLIIVLALVPEIDLLSDNFLHFIHLFAVSTILSTATPIHDGMRTPMRDRAWNPYAPMSPPRFVLESD